MGKSLIIGEGGVQNVLWLDLWRLSGGRPGRARPGTRCLPRLMPSIAPRRMGRRTFCHRGEESGALEAMVRRRIGRSLYDEIGVFGVLVNVFVDEGTDDIDLVAFFARPV